jgi:KAP family P-loop domain
VPATTTSGGIEPDLPPTRRLARLRMLSDRPVDDPRADFFGYRDYAQALADLIDSEGTDTPLTVAVSAPWGAGKTSVARMVERQLHDWTRQRGGERRMVTCWFPAWMHGDAPHLGAAMAGAIARVANGARPMWRRVLAPLPTAMLSPKERWWRRVRIGIGALAVVLVACAIRPVRELARPLLGDWSAPAAAGSAVALLVLASLLWKQVFAAAEQAAKFIDDPRSEAARGSMVQVREQLGRLIHQATRGGRLVVFVDDLERCPPERAVEVCEVASQLLSHEDVVTVFVADMQAVARAAEKHHVGVEGDDTGRRYLEKVVQIELAVPPPPPEAMERLLCGLAPEAEPDRGRTDTAAYVPAIVSRWSSMAAMQGLGLLLSLLVGIGYLVFGEPDPFYGAFRHASTILRSVNGLFLFMMIGQVLATVAFAVRMEVQRRLARRRRQQINRLIQAKRDAGVPQDELEERVLAELKPKLAPLASKLVETYLVDFAAELDPVEEVIRSYPPPLPRAAKRMLNHARLLTRIARDRRLFGGDPELVPMHLGKWIVLQECWRALAKAVLGRPAVLGVLELDATKGNAALGDGLRREGIQLDHFDALGDLLRSEPRLGLVVERLIRFEPAEDPDEPGPEPGAEPALVGGPAG